MFPPAVRRIRRHLMLFIAAILCVLTALATPTSAQIRQIDPNDAIDADLGSPSKRTAIPAPVASDNPAAETETTVSQEPGADAATTTAAPDSAGSDQTFKKNDILSAAEGVFGKGAKGLAGIIEDILRKQGEPNGYIVGREGGGAFVVGVRYGSGKLMHKIEGEMPAYWTGPSVGFDAGANVGSTFVLVYNLYDTEDLYKRFVAGEGAAYLVGGFNASYMRRGDVVLIPIRVGAGLRLGVNAGYMKFSKKQRWLPF